MNSHKRTLLNVLCALLAAAAACAAYYNTLGNEFVYDDLVIVSNNPNIRDFSNVPRMLTRDYFFVSGERTYRPLNTLSYFVDMKLWNGSAAGFHFTNMAFHAVNSVLLFFLFLLLGGNWVAALFGALLFAVHPLNTEAVSGASFREDVMALGFVAAGLLIYARRRAKESTRGSSRKWVSTPIWIGILFMLGLASKESAAVLAPALLMYEWIYGQGDAWRARLGRAVPTAIALLLSGGVFFAAYFALGHFSGGPKGDLPSATFAGNMQIMTDSFFRYFRLSVYPAPLCLDYLVGQTGGPVPPATIAAFVALALLLILGFVSRRSYRGMSFGLLFFFLALLPVSNIVPFGAVFSERYAYMPLAGLCLAIPCLFFEQPRSQTETSSTAKWISPLYASFFLVLCVTFGFIAANRNLVWRNELTLWKDTVSCCPKSPRANTNLGRAYFLKGMFAEAKPYLENAVQIDPDNYEAQNALGSVYRQLDMPYPAINAFNQAIRIKPEAKYTYYNLGLVYRDVGNREKAESYFQKTLALDPAYADAAYELGVIYQNTGRVLSAESMMMKVLAKNPKYYKALSSLAFIYSKTGRIARAEQMYLHMIETLSPNNPIQRAARETLASLYSNTGRNAEAQQMFRQLLKELPPNDTLRPTVEAGLDRLLLRCKKFKCDN